MHEELKTQLEVLASATNQFPVDFDLAWDWIGYTRKDTAKERLLRNFAQNADFSLSRHPAEFGKGTSPEKIWLSIGCFKQFCMMAGTQKGREVREYFIQCEQRLKQVPQLMSLEELALAAITGLREKVAEQKAQIEVLAPKAEVYDQIANATNDHSISHVAKVLGLGPRKFFDLLKTDRILQRNNLPYQPFLDHGYFRVVAKPIRKGPNVENYLQTYVTSQGLEYLARRYGGQPPLIAA